MRQVGSNRGHAAIYSADSAWKSQESVIGSFEFAMYSGRIYAENRYTDKWLQGCRTAVGGKVSIGLWRFLPTGYLVIQVSWGTPLQPRSAEFQGKPDVLALSRLADNDKGRGSLPLKLLLRRRESVQYGTHAGEFAPNPAELSRAIQTKGDETVHAPGAVNCNRIGDSRAR